MLLMKKTENSVLVFDGQQNVPFVFVFVFLQQHKHFGFMNIHNNFNYHLTPKRN